MPNETIPSNEIQSILTTNWNAGIVTTPTFFELNSDSNPLRVDFRSADYVIIAPESPVFTEEPRGYWRDGDQVSQVLVEIYTRNSRQRLYNLMREVRRIIHNRQHSSTNYQRIGFQSFSELTESQQLIWVGRVIIELVNSGITLNTAD